MFLAHQENFQSTWYLQSPRQDTCANLSSLSSSLQSGRLVHSVSSASIANSSDCLLPKEKPLPRPRPLLQSHQHAFQVVFLLGAASALLRRSRFQTTTEPKSKGSRVSLVLFMLGVVCVVSGTVSSIFVRAAGISLVICGMLFFAADRVLSLETDCDRLHVDQYV